MIERTTGPLRGLRVLVAEDEWLLSEFIAEILRRLECTVVGPGRNVEEALQAIWTRDIDGALMDVHLGEASVRPAANELKRRGVPFIFMTGHTNLAGSSLLGNAPLLNEPLKVQQLEDMMHSTFVTPGRPC